MKSLMAPVWLRSFVENDKVARATNDKVHLFQELARAVLDPEVSDQELRPAIFAWIPAEQLRHALVEAEEMSRPLDDNYFDFLANRYRVV